MKYEQIINRLIPADDLHWDEHQRRFASISRDEVDGIVAKCIDQGITDLDEINKIVHWCGFVRIGLLLRDAWLSDRVRIAGVGEDGPYFAPLQNAP